MLLKAGIRIRAVTRLRDGLDMTWPCNDHQERKNFSSVNGGTHLQAACVPIKEHEERSAPGTTDPVRYGEGDSGIAHVGIVVQVRQPTRPPSMSRNRVGE